MSYELKIQVKYTNHDGDTIFVTREAEINKKREAKDLLKSALKTYHSEMCGVEITDTTARKIVALVEEERGGTVYDIDEDTGIPKWM